MPPQRCARSTASGLDRISELPEGVLHRVLSLLPAHDAVRTCVLAQRWRHLWGWIRVTGVKGWRIADRFVGFVDRLLSLRSGGAPLEAVEFELDPSDFYFNFYLLADNWCASHWIQRALRCNAQVLQLSLDDMAAFRLPGLPLVSEHVTRLELDCVTTKNSVLDFSRCPALVEMKMEYCYITSDIMSSVSLKKLSMTGCEFLWQKRTRISLPSLVSLELTRSCGRAPLLECMPSLATGIVSFEYDCEDYCLKGECYDGSCDDCRFHEIDDDHTSCVLLNGLSQATHLELSSYPDMVCLQLHSSLTLVVSFYCILCNKHVHHYNSLNMSI
ncbi:hypothetical protein BAE44_0006697 [Dichanthelium oligosanthes]|uniref:F-box domain-containing protein n=1 Tax=Dichanthelium oligosanthes TaxID=888268 RepID=A0A1E5W4N0_9POAL|nr:hypothetical protein BAE44_0006697 [Dichanthelium oligosanthes]